MARAVLTALLLLLASLACFGLTSSLRRTDGDSTLEWVLDKESGALSVHVYTSGRHGAPKSQLYAFEAEVTVAEMLQSQMVRDVAADHMDESKAHCIVLGGTNRGSIDSSAALVNVLHTESSVELVCKGPARRHSRHADKKHASWLFTQFEAQKLDPNAVREHNEQLRAQSGGSALLPYPKTSTEILAQSWEGVRGWVQAFLEHHWGPMHPVNSYVNSTTQTGRWHLNTGAVLRPGASFGRESDSRIRVGIAADWGAGTFESDCVQRVMSQGNSSSTSAASFPPHWTLHVGDIYFVGAPDEVKANCLGVAPPGVEKGVKWPHGSLGSFAVQGNHEMYSRGFGFFDTFLPTLGVKDWQTGRMQGQEAGYLSMENAYWRIILLDTGYNTYAKFDELDSHNNTQPQEVIDWLRDVVQIGNASDTRGIIFLSHHQAQSAFSNPSMATPIQIAELMPPGRTAIWLWGHEHRAAWYDVQSVFGAKSDFKFYGRCMGNSGFPASNNPLPAKAKLAGLRAYDARVYKIWTGLYNMAVSYNGFVHMDLERDTVSFTYSTLAIDPTTGDLSNNMQSDLVREKFEVDGKGNVQLVSFDIVNPDITVVI